MVVKRVRDIKTHLYTYLQKKLTSVAVATKMQPPNIQRNVQNTSSFINNDARNQTHKHRYHQALLGNKTNPFLQIVALHLNHMVVSYKTENFSAVIEVLLVKYAPVECNFKKKTLIVFSCMHESCMYSTREL